MKLELTLMYCFVCNGATEHVVVMSGEGEIIKRRCRRCKHKHVVGSNEV